MTQNPALFVLDIMWIHADFQSNARFADGNSVFEEDAKNVFLIMKSKFQSHKSEKSPLSLFCVNFSIQCIKPTIQTVIVESHGWVGRIYCLLVTNI